MPRYHVAGFSLFLCLVSLTPLRLQATPPIASLIPGITPQQRNVSEAQALYGDPNLQETVNVETTDRPLSDVLSGLSPKLKVDLITSSQVADQRVTLHVTDQPLHHVMWRLVGLLSHNPADPHGYHWERLERAPGRRPGYRLWRDNSSIAAEQDELDYPRREMVLFLRDIRNLSRLSPEKQKKYEGELPLGWFTTPEDQPYRDAFRGLSDADIDTLARGEHLPLDRSVFAASIDHYNQKWHDNLVQQRQTEIAEGQADPYPDGVPEAPPYPPEMYVSTADYGGSSPERAHLYGIHLQGVQEGYSVLDPYVTRRRPLLLPWLSTDKTPVVDLTPLLKDKSVTDKQRVDVGFTLQSLAKAAHINVYQEQFFRPNPMEPPVSEHGLDVMKGPLPRIIASICYQWDYQVANVGGDYIFWSRQWAQDRANDVPERLIEDWRSRFKKKGRFTLDDRAEMAVALTWPQIKITLNKLLPESGPWSMQNDVSALRVIGRLSAEERNVATSEKGLALTDLSLWQQQEVLQEFSTQLWAATSDQLNHARLQLGYEQVGPPRLKDHFERISFTISADGQKLMSTIMAFPLPKAGQAEASGASPASHG